MDSPNAKFKKGYLIYILILFTVFLGVLVYLWISLAKYQKAADGGDAAFSEEESAIRENEKKDEEEAQKAFQIYMAGLTVDDYVNLYFNNHPERLDSYENVSSFIADRIINAGYKQYKARDFAPEAPKYVIMADGETLAQFDLSKAGAWAVSSADILISGNETLSVKAASNTQLTVNGHEINTEMIPYETEPATLKEYEDSLSNPAAFNVFTVGGMISSDADIMATNGRLACDGVIYELAPEGEENRGKAEEFVKALLKYSALGKENTAGNKSVAMSFVASNSNASKVINETASGLEWVPPKHNISYTVASTEAMRLADNCYFIDVDYFLIDANEQKSEPEDSESISDEESAEDDKNHSVYRIFFLNSGDGYQIVEFSGV